MEVNESIGCYFSSKNIKARALLMLRAKILLSQEFAVYHS